jgi:hypothetical protein
VVEREKAWRWLRGQLDKQHRHANGGDGYAVAGGKNRGGKEIRNALAINMLVSPVIPSCIEPKIPVPLAQNRIMMAT